MDGFTGKILRKDRVDGTKKINELFRGKKGPLTGCANHYAHTASNESSRDILRRKLTQQTLSRLTTGTRGKGKRSAVGISFQVKSYTINGTS